MQNSQEVNNKKSEVINTESSTEVSKHYITHFTNSFDVLLCILQDGFKPGFSKEQPIHKRQTEILSAIDFYMGNPAQIVEFEEIAMVCFCDIPIRLSKKHRAKYGSYGISFLKNWAEDKKISPVTYVFENSKSGDLFFSIHSIFNSLKSEIEKIPEHFQIKSNTKLLDYNLSQLWCGLKPYIDSITKEKFYDEREWRYIPDDFEIKDKFNKKKYLKFEISEIYRIFVTTDEEVNILKAYFFNNNENQISKNIRILTPRLP